MTGEILRIAAATTFTRPTTRLRGKMRGCPIVRYVAEDMSSRSSSPPHPPAGMADRVVIVWPEIGDYLSILPPSSPHLPNPFFAPFLSRTISGEKSGNNRKGSLSLKRVIKLMIRGGAAPRRAGGRCTDSPADESRKKRTMATDPRLSLS